MLPVMVRISSHQEQSRASTHSPRGIGGRPRPGPVELEVPSGFAANHALAASALIRAEFVADESLSAQFAKSTEAEAEDDSTDARRNTDIAITDIGLSASLARELLMMRDCRRRITPRQCCRLPLLRLSSLKGWS